MIKVLPIWEKTDPSDIVVNTTSRSKESWSLELSPFYLGPVKLYGEWTSRRMENAWQYAKVYADFLSGPDIDLDRYFTWAKDGWSKNYAVRYPMGKIKPEFLLWDGERLDYITARRRVYIPLYSRAVVKTSAFSKLVEIYKSCPNQNLVLQDFDAYDHRSLNMTYTDVINCPSKKMGHAFVLAMLLEKLA